MKIGFFGAVGTVTGSKFLVEHEDTRILVDCGLYQGFKELRNRNWSPFPFEVSSIDAVVLTHAHLDHSGALPLLGCEGFHGPVYATKPTIDLSRIILLDAAKIQEEDAAYAAKKGFSKHNPPLALYTTEDVMKVLPQFREVGIKQEITVGSLAVTYYSAGHILGATSVQISDGEKTVLFSGDLGRSADPLIFPPDVPPSSSVVVMESTYGDRIHSDISSKEILAECVHEIAKSKGVLLIPSFAVGRAQNILSELVELRTDGKIPRQIPIYFNSPMGHEVAALFEKYPSFHRLRSGQFAEMMADVHSVHTADESKELNRKSGPMVIVASSGMLTGGRVLHHLKAFAPDERNVILLAGFQSPGTRGWNLVRGDKQIKVHGDYVAVNAKVVSSDSFSAHADQEELMRWLGQMRSKPEKILLVHGEKESSETLGIKIHKELGVPVQLPVEEQFVEI